jgi:glycosyltransferase involved in cell wall biosynthesis
MHILTLEPYYGGSHRAFLDGWTSNSHHRWTTLNLPAHKWKWRMRHSAITLSEQVQTLAAGGAAFDLLFCSDMLNLAEFKGLAPESIRQLPAVVYFHENQLTYPVRREDERDLHFGMINCTTALVADQVWFNSAFHRDSFFGALKVLLHRMPDYNHVEVVDILARKSVVYPQGIAESPARGTRTPGPPRILWVARWEHDKNPELFFRAMRQLKDDGFDFHLSVIGEQFSEMPPIFSEARLSLGDRIDRWGYQPTRSEYERALAEADIIVSTADHEFFGVGVVEAVAAGAHPLLPKRLAYPEIFGSDEQFFYDGSFESLVSCLKALLVRTNEGCLWERRPDRLTHVVEKYYWKNLAPRLDDALQSLTRSKPV